jgi:capsid protein
MALFDFLRPKEEPMTRRERRGIRKLVRNYSGANQGRLFADFIASSFSADSELKTNLPILRDRSRDLSRNNEYAKRFLNLIKTNVVGEKGFSIQVRARNDDRSLDAAGNAIIENAFKAWGRMGGCEVSGRMSDLVDHNKNGRNENNNNEIRMGVELDSFHRPVAYYVLTDHPNDDFTGKVRPRKHNRVPAEQIIHVFMPTRTYQTRGEPFMAPAITSLKHLAAWREASVVAARASAAKFGVITTPGGDEFVGDDETQDGVDIISFEPASVAQLPAGHNFEMIDPKHPTSNFAEFETAMLRGIASALNVAYTALSNDLTGVSYSSIRQGAIEERDHYKMMQSFLIQHFCEPVFRAWLDSALDFGNVPIPLTKYDKFADNVHFRGRGFAWVDPMKEINAAVTAINNGLMSMNDVAANYGRDTEELFAQIQSDKEMAERYGLKMAFEPFGMKMPAEPDIDGGDDDGDL